LIGVAAPCHTHTHTHTPPVVTAALPCAMFIFAVMFAAMQPRLRSSRLPTWRLAAGGTISGTRRISRHIHKTGVLSSPTSGEIMQARCRLVLRTVLLPVECHMQPTLICLVLCCNIMPQHVNSCVNSCVEWCFSRRFSQALRSDCSQAGMIYTSIGFLGKAGLRGQQHACRGQAAATVCCQSGEA
jgi:hypothetical protein